MVMLVATACGAGTAGRSTAPSADPTKDKLAQVIGRGTLVGYAELDYPPQSIRVDGAKRAAVTKCQANQITAGEVTGFDIETTKLVAKALGVEACFIQPSWTEVTSGGWGDRFDLAYGSGAINATRMEHLWMTLPYYYIPQRFVVQLTSSAKTAPDLDGKRIGTCTSCTVESYLKGTLKIPGVDLIQKVKNPVLVGYETEAPGLEALAAGKIDAFLTAEPVAAQAVKDGKPVRLLDEPAFSMYPTGFVDKSSGLSVKALVDRVDAIMATAHEDGTMKAMSMQWFGQDYTTQAASFDLSKLAQVVP
ncbi:MAG: transporter substrate-binding domain-containing protein [Candidatus Limnocylindrales bacterium]